VASELDYSIENTITLSIQATDSADNISEPTSVVININEVAEDEVQNGNDDDSGSLLWLTLLLAPLSVLRRFKKK